LGPFAVTPQRLAAGRRERAEDRVAFFDLVDRVELDWRRAAYGIGNVLQWREHQVDRDPLSRTTRT
jgi:hypothetical protein